MSHPIMSKVVAIWLINNTSLTFQQIGDYCGMHRLAVEALANQDHIVKQGLSPISTGELTEEELKRCEADPNAKMQYNHSAVTVRKNAKSPVSKFKKQAKPKAILWLIQNYPKNMDGNVF